MLRIGVSLVEDTRFAGKDIGSHYQFEDRLGLVTDFGENMNQSIALRYMHYSNGCLLYTSDAAENREV